MEYKKFELKPNEEKTEENDIFSKEKVNIGRQPEVDYLKAFLIFLMVNDHVYYHYSLGSFNFFKIMAFIIFVSGAGGFMLSMGIGMKYSRHHEPKNYFSRGIILLTQGQYLNLIRDSIPNLISWWITGNKIFISRALLVLSGDILTFAGIAFCFLALLKKMKLSDNFILIISIILNVFALLLYNIMKSPKNFLLSTFVGYFVLTDAESYFPLFSYFIFVAFGYLLGGICQKINNKDKFYNIILIVCFPILLIYYCFRFNYNYPMFPKNFSDEHYSIYPCPDALFSCMWNLTVLAFFYQIDKLLKGKTPYFVTHISKNLNEYYIISSIFTIDLKIFLIAIKGEEFPSKMNYPFLFSIMIIIFCRILIDLNNKYIHFAITTLNNPLRNFAFALIWILTFIIVLYAYPKVESYATIWNNYLKEDVNIYLKYSGVIN